MANLRRLMTSPPPPPLISTVRSSLSTSITRLISTSPETLPNINNQNEQDPIKQTQNHENENEQEEDDDLEGNEPDMNKDTGEIGGPKGPEPTRYGDWERKIINILNSGRKRRPVRMLGSRQFFGLPTSRGAHGPKTRPDRPKPNLAKTPDRIKMVRYKTTTMGKLAAEIRDPNKGATVWLGDGHYTDIQDVRSSNIEFQGISLIYQATDCL
nr:hypothetical protein [Tanacetum cinerariifolium]